MIALAALLLAKGSLLLGAALLVARAAPAGMPRSSLPWRAVFAALALLPVAEALVPRWELGLVTVDHGALARPVGFGGAQGTLAGWLVAAWLAGAAVVAARFGLACRRAARLVRRCTDVGDPRVLALFTRAARRVGVRDAVRLVESRELETPAVFGWRRPSLVLPAAAAGWSDDELFAVLCHELAHVRRGDWIALALERGVAAVYWPNPLVHLAGRRAAFARELAADRAALEAGAAPAQLAARIIATARAARPGTLAAVAGLGGSGVHARVRALFESPRGTGGGGAGRRVLLWLAPLTLAVAAAQPSRCVPPVVDTPASQACP